MDTAIAQASSASLPFSASNASFAYGEALQKSFLFYEAQRAGDLSSDNRIEWRGDSTLADGSDVGVDLSGGYFDAGDTLKLVFPMSSALTMLSWGAIEYRDAYVASGQLDEVLDAVKWGTDFLLNAHQTDTAGTTQALWGQVGDVAADHGQWGSAENVHNVTSRPSYKIDRLNPGTDLASEAAAALAAASILFRPTDSVYANTLLDNAKQLYRFANDADSTTPGNQRGKYSDNLTNPNGVNYENLGVYDSYEYNDELAWGAAWLYKASTAAGASNNSYLNQARSTYANGLWNEGTQSWDGKDHGTAILLAQITGESQYKTSIETWLNNWMPGGGVPYTTGGLAYAQAYEGFDGDQDLRNEVWASLRYSANTAFLAGVYNDTVSSDARYADFAQDQINYILGDNPRNSSYLIGFGNNFPVQPHHGGAHGISGWENYDSPQPNQNVLYGGLVGGPSTFNDFSYRDDRTDYQGNEVALDYNAAFTGALARLYGLYGGAPLTDAQLDALPGIRIDQVTGNQYYGTSGDDTLYGTNANDSIFGLGGNDTLIGFAGSDLLEGGAGRDRLFGYEGTDTLKGGEGDDLLNGGSDDDTLYGDAGNDILNGGQSGNDTLYGGAGTDTLYGLSGNDVLEGEADNDILSGGDGDDVLNGGSGEDRLFGYAGNDTQRGGLDNDILNGGDGNDTLYGDAGNDILNGGQSGDDTLYGGANNDTLYGLDGNDVIYGEDGNDIIGAGAGDDYAEGGAGDDTVSGLDGNDTLSGGSGRDRLFGYGGVDTLYGGFGDDLLNGGRDNDVLFGDAGNDTLNGGQSGNDTLAGGTGDDVLLGLDGADFLYGEMGNDVLSGGDGSDYLSGGFGDDLLVGGNGNDTLLGGELNTSGSVAQIDRLDGGTGADAYIVQYMYSRFGNSDYALIKGFSTANDVIELGSGSHTLSATGGALPGGTGIYSSSGDLLAIVEGYGAGSLNLGASYFAYNYA